MMENNNQLYDKIIHDLPKHLQNNQIVTNTIKQRPLHGHFGQWIKHLEELLSDLSQRIKLENLETKFDQHYVEIKSKTQIEMPEDLIEKLKAIAPWRKGPFNILNTVIESEWRCQEKFARLQAYGPKMADKRILDVGSGNGYFGFRFLGAGAKQVLGIDPSQLYWCQFQAIKMWVPHLPISQIPLTAEAIHKAKIGRFDQVYSMGVLYHRKSPIEHLFLLKDFLKPEGILVLETLFVQGAEGYALMPENTYGKMRNVWFIPTLRTLNTWLKRVGFDQIKCVNTCVTHQKEQAKTAWMKNESLNDFLDPNDKNLTTEGYPRPQRAIFVARKPT